MGVAAKGRSGRENLSCIVAAFVAVSIVFLLVEAVPASQGAAADFKVSETCYGTGNCSLHTLSCSGGKLAVLEASYAFKLKQAVNNCINAGNDDTCPDNCCSYNETSDCKVTYTADNLKRVQSNCSHSASCQTRAQWANNVQCSPGERAATSTVSVLRAVCVPAATAVDPCANATVSGHTVSLDLPRPPLPSSPCQCTVHKTTTANATTTTNDNNNNGTVDVYVYETVSSSADWGQAVVEDSGGTVLWQTSGVGTTFPASVVSSSLSSLPLSASFSFRNLSDVPRRLWLGFRGEESSLTLRCGQDAVDYAMSLMTTTTAPPTTTMEPTTTATPTAPATKSTVTEQRTTSQGGADSTPLTSEPPRKAATDIIVYTMVGVSALLLLAFLYVFIRQLRKKGCPACCPPPCHQLHCGKLGPPDHHHHHHHHREHRQPRADATTHHASISDTTIIIADTSTNNTGTRTGGSPDELRLGNGSVAGFNGGLGNGHFVRLTGENGGVPSAFTQRRCSFEHLRRPRFVISSGQRGARGSIQSLRRASFSNLENISETEEDEEDNNNTKKEPTPGHPGHHLPLCRQHPHHASDPLHPHPPHTPQHVAPPHQHDIVKLVDERLATIEAEERDRKGEFGGGDDDDVVQSDEDEPRVLPQGSREALTDPQQPARSPPQSSCVKEKGRTDNLSAEKDDRSAEKDNHSAEKDKHSAVKKDNHSAEKDNPSRDKEAPQGGAGVVFHLGDLNEPSDPDLEQYFTQL